MLTSTRLPPGLAPASPPALDRPATRRPPLLPGGTLLAGHLRELAADNLALFGRCAELHGIARIRVYGYRCHVITDPALVGELLVEHPDAFKKTRALQVARPTFGNGLATSEGEAWRRQQRMLRGFFSPRAAAGYRDLMHAAIDEKLATWRPGEIRDLHEDMIDVSLEIVCRAFFGIGATEVRTLVRDAAEAVQRWHHDCERLCLPVPHYLPTPANLRYRLATRRLDREVRALIREVRERRSDDHGLLSAMLKARDEDGTAIPEQEIRDQVVTLFLAGHDTTASTLAFALLELSHRPDLQTWIAEQLEDDDRSECLDRVLEETLRLYPAVHLVARTALRDVDLGDYRVLRGEEVIVPLSILHRRPDLFPDPHAFRPERFLPEARRGCPRHAHVPFSAGPRVCTGRAVAMEELRTVLAAILRRHRLEPVGPREPRVRAHLTLFPAPGSTLARIAEPPALAPGQGGGA